MVDLLPPTSSWVANVTPELNQANGAALQFSTEPRMSMLIVAADYPQLGQANVPAYTGAMAEIVNLRRARKAKQRAAKEEEAKANRIVHGLTKAERDLAKAESDAGERKLDGHKRDDA